MSVDNRAKLLVATIDNAIEQASDLGLDFVVHILMMARLEADQRDLGPPTMQWDNERRH